MAESRGEIFLESSLELNLSENERKEIINTAEESMQIIEGTKIVNELYDSMFKRAMDRPQEKELVQQNEQLGEMLKSKDEIKELTKEKREREKLRQELEDLKKVSVMRSRVRNYFLVLNRSVTCMPTRRKLCLIWQSKLYHELKGLLI